MSNHAKEAGCQNFSFEIYADHSQFIIQDEGATPETSNSTKLHMLTVEDGLIYVGTWRYATVAVEMQLCEAKPTYADDLQIWDHVEEATIQSFSGQIRVRETLARTPQDLIIMLPANIYRIRVYYKGLDLNKIDEEDGSDSYQITIWPDSYSAPTVLKKLTDIELYFPI